MITSGVCRRYQDIKITKTNESRKRDNKANKSETNLTHGTSIVFENVINVRDIRSQHITAVEYYSLRFELDVVLEQNFRFKISVVL